MQIVSTFSKVVEFGQIVKVQADAIYYTPFDQKRILTPTPIVEGSILENLGKFTATTEDRIVKQQHKTILDYVPYNLIKKTL